MINQVDDQIIEPVGYDFGFTRRTFVQVLGAGILIAVASPSIGLSQERRGGGGRGQARPTPLDARVHVGKDGAITIMTGKVECGQGSRAEITQAAAEELNVPIDRISLVMADTALCPDDGITAGSRTTPSTLPSIRAACAALRQLVEKSGKSLAEFANSDEQSLKQIAPADVQVIPASDWKILGQSTPRPNRRDIVTGAHHYPSDIIRPGMLYGKMRRPLSYGAKLTDLDTSGIADATVVRDGNFVGVAAANTHLAKAAIKQLEQSAKWEAAPHPPSKELFDHLRKNAKIPAAPFEPTSKVLRATYHVPYIQHAPMEPRAAVAEWDEQGRLTVWTATQNPFGVRRELASAFHIDESQVRVIVPDFGGGFGGKHTGETAVEAARLAKGAKKPLALRWTRAEEFTWAAFRPAAVIDIEASLDDANKLATWNFISINPGRSGVESPYRCAKNNSQAIDSAPPLRQSSYRALASTAHNFARESFMNELAKLAGADPLTFRLDHIEDERLRAALKKATDEFGWSKRMSGKRPDNVGIGLSCATEKGSFVAACAQVEIDKIKKLVKVKHVVQAFDCGAITNPSNLKSQITGAIIQGIGPVLREAMQFEGGKITNASFFKYEVPRMADVPRIDVHLIDRRDVAPAGAGETPLIAVAPAVANAVFDATGQRLRELPLKLKSA